MFSIGDRVNSAWWVLVSRLCAVDSVHSKMLRHKPLKLETMWTRISHVLLFFCVSETVYIYIYIYIYKMEKSDKTNKHNSFVFQAGTNVMTEVYK